MAAPSDVDESARTLSEVKADVFHRTVAKLLYVATRARMDILLPVCFLCTRISVCTSEDESKLKRVLEYLNGTLDLVYTIGADDLTKVHTWVDASYAVHPDMRSHTGGLMSFGTGALVCRSAKQKLNTKSSTEAELVGASDYIANTIWMKMFLEAQGYKVTENIFEQDNESAIRLERNGRNSAGSKSRHINIRYFFIKDRINSERITIRHCPTLQMLADFFTKPLQGTLFHRIRDIILGYKHVSEIKSFLTSPGEERVGDDRPGSVLDYQDDGNDTYVENMKTTLKDNEETKVKNSNEVSWIKVVKKGRKRDHSLETIPS